MEYLSHYSAGEIACTAFITVLVLGIGWIGWEMRNAPLKDHCECRNRSGYTQEYNGIRFCNDCFMGLPIQPSEETLKVPDKNICEHQWKSIPNSEFIECKKCLLMANSRDKKTINQ